MAGDQQTYPFLPLYLLLVCLGRSDLNQRRSSPSVGDNLGHYFCAAQQRSSENTVNPPPDDCGAPDTNATLLRANAAKRRRRAAAMFVFAEPERRDRAGGDIATARESLFREVSAPPPSWGDNCRVVTFKDVTAHSLSQRRSVVSPALPVRGRRPRGQANVPPSSKLLSSYRFPVPLSKHSRTVGVVILLRDHYSALHGYSACRIAVPRNVPPLSTCGVPTCRVLWAFRRST